MKRFDKNGDGAITFNEFAPLHERIFSRLDRAEEFVRATTLWLTWV